MRKLFASIILSFVLFLPILSVAKPAFAQEDMVTTTSEDTVTSSEDEYYYDDYYYDDEYLYDTSYYPYDIDFGVDYVPTGEAAGALAGMAALLFSGVMLVVFLIFGIGSYVYTSLALMKIAKRLNHENAWYAWIPILNMVLLFQLGEQNPVLLLLLLIPGIGGLIVGILAIIALMKVCEKRGYDKALGLLSLIPIANYVLLGILAWGKKEA